MKIENNPQALVFALGEHYPANGLHKDGATAHFFSRNDDNILGIFTHIGAIEEHILKFGCVEFGLLYQNRALLLVFQFFCQIYKNLKLCFSAPFDERETWVLDLPCLVDEGLAVTIHVVNSKDNTLQDIRKMRLGYVQTLVFFSAIQDQLSEIRGGGDILAGWLCRDAMSLTDITDMELMESDIAANI